MRLVGDFVESSPRKMENITDHKIGNMTGKSLPHSYSCHRGKLSVPFLGEVLKHTSLRCVIVRGRKQDAHIGIILVVVGNVDLLIAQTRLKCGSGCSTIVVRYLCVVG